MAELEDVRILAEELIVEHLGGGWKFEFDRAKRRSGACHYQTTTISLSRYVAETATLFDMHQVMLHEIAHALAGPRAGHGKKWATIAHGLGYDDRKLDGTEVDARYAPYIGTCPNGHVIYRYRRPRAPMSCGSCASTFNPKYLVRFHQRSQRASSATQ